MYQSCTSRFITLFSDYQYSLIIAEFKMIQSIIRIIVSPERRKAAREIMDSLIGPMHVVPGCICYRMYQDLENENRLVLEQEWESEMALHRFIRSNTYIKILALIELSSQSPEILFNSISIIGGIDIVEDVRGEKTI
ncbi:putative quinol monooxygenase [Thermodesulfobacteriota bacterium]